MMKTGLEGTGLVNNAGKKIKVQSTSPDSHGKWCTLCMNGLNEASAYGRRLRTLRSRGAESSLPIPIVVAANSTDGRPVAAGFDVLADFLTEDVKSSAPYSS